MDWNEFELTVRWIYEKLGSKLGVEVVGYGPSCRHVGKSGATHQIDVLLSHSDGVHAYSAAIECKWWKEKVDKDVVIKSAFIRDDCGFDKAIVVSKIGFTDDAIKVADERNVHLVELKEHNLQISGNTLTKFYMHNTISQPEFVGWQVNVDPEMVTEYNSHKILRAGGQYIYTAKKETLEPAQLINDFLNKEVLPLTHSDLFTSNRTFEPQARLKSRNVRGSIPITGVQLTGYNRIYTRLDNDYFLNRIWLAMKLVFEKKQLMVTVTGDIQPWDSGEPIQSTVGRIIRLRPLSNAKQFKIVRDLQLLNGSSDIANQQDG